MQYSSSARLASPTGALTETKVAPLGALLIGAIVHFRAVGLTAPNSAFPCRNGVPLPNELYVSDGGDWPITTSARSPSGTSWRKLLAAAVNCWADDPTDPERSG